MLSYQQEINKMYQNIIHLHYYTTPPVQNSTRAKLLGMIAFKICSNLNKRWNFWYIWCYNKKIDLVEKPHFFGWNWQTLLSMENWIFYDLLPSCVKEFFFFVLNLLIWTEEAEILNVFTFTFSVLIFSYNSILYWVQCVQFIYIVLSSVYT